MAVKELVTRQFLTQGEDGARYDVTRHGRPAPPQSVAEWVQLRVAALSGTSGAASRVTVRALLADDTAAVKAAVAEGKGLSEIQRHAVLQTLETCAKLAREGYGPASGRMGQLVAAWTRAYGSKLPRHEAI